MAAIARVALTDPMLVRGWMLDVRIASAWTPVSGLQGGKPLLDPTSKDTSTSDGAGWKANTITMMGWGFQGKLLRGAQNSTPASYDVGQEYLRTQSRLMGAARTIYFRYFEVNGDVTIGTQTINGIKYPISEAWEGYGNPEWDEANDGVDDERVIAFKITGKGAPIASAFSPASA